MRKLTIITALFIMLPLVSQAKTLDELMAEKGIVAQDEIRADMHGSKVYWNKGTRLEFPDTGFSTRIFTELRTRYEFTDYDDGIDNDSSFDVNNVRLGVAGHILNSEFGYYIKAALTGDKNTWTGRTDATSADILDAYITWSPCDEGELKMGQFKSAVSRAYNTSLVNMQFADRSIASDFFDLGRQAGLAASMDVGGLTVGAQVLDGIDENVVDHNDTDHTYVLHARLPITGEIDSSIEGDVDYTEELGADLGVAYAHSVIDKDDLNTVSVDANVKSQGFSLHSELFWNELSVDSVSGSPDYDGIGYYVQAGYFLTPKDLELAARYSYVDCDNGKSLNCAALGVALDDISEVNVSLNKYWWAHHLKAQIGYSILTLDAGSQDTDVNRWLLQLSGWF